MGLFFILQLHIVVFAQKDLGNGFYDHGPTSNIAYPRGIVATDDGKGNNIVLCWLFDHRGGYALLLVDAKTGESQQFPAPFPVDRDAPYASLLSANNKYYTLFNGYFTEFDPAKKEFSFIEKTLPRASMAMLEDKAGNIWAATYPRCGLVRFDPHTNTLKDFGSLYQQNWSQYPKYIASDDKGWIYIAIGTTYSQIIAFDTTSKKAIPLFNEDERQKGSAYLFKGADGYVYGKILNENQFPWFRLENGKKIMLHEAVKVNEEYKITGNQNLFHKKFPNEDVLTQFELSKRYLTVQHHTDKTEQKVNFDYSTVGSWSMGVMAGNNGKLYGGLAFPMMLFSFDPKTNQSATQFEHSQLNALEKSGNKIYFGGYPMGDLIEYDPSKPWNGLKRKSGNSNPKYVFNCSPVINRPHRVIALKDGRTIIMSGTPEYGHTGGGLLFWDNISRRGTLMKDSSLITNHSTMSLLELPNGKLLGGTTIAAGTGGEVKVKQAVLYIMDIGTKKMEWHEPIVAGAREYNDLCMNKNGFVYGITNTQTFFVFDPSEKKLIKTTELEKGYGRTVYEQSPRIFVKDDKGQIYILFRNKIGIVNQEDFTIKTIADSPVPLTAGGTFLNGKIYFLSESHLCSFALK